MPITDALPKFTDVLPRRAAAASVLPMTEPTHPRLIFWRRVAVIALTLGIGALIVHFGRLLPTVGAQGVLTDFDAFYIAGDLVRQGRAEVAYDIAQMAAIQRDLAGVESFMPWTYPPPYDLFVALLPGMERGVAFVVFGLTTWGLFVAAVAGLAGRYTLLALIAVLPPIYVTATIGQNAFLSAGLIGAFAWASQHRHRHRHLRARPIWAGIALGLMVIKPHLAITLGLFALCARRWGTVITAGAVVITACAAATLVLGPGIWPAFLGAVDQAGTALATGFYPLFRMTSGYALAQTLGASPATASMVQAGCALAALAVTGWAALRQPPRRALAVAVFAAVLISPYVYDYDMVLIAVALALIARDLAARASIARLGLVVVTLWVAGGWAMVQAISNAGLPWAERAAIAQETVAWGALAYVLALVQIALILRAPPRPAHP